jgi:hypothetical protein
MYSKFASGPRTLTGVNRYLDILVDICNRGDTDWKQGGTVENNCLRWRIDPNNNW